MLALDAAVKGRVQKGLVFLREKYGEDWVEHIDMKTLTLSDGDCCVLGQVHPAYHSVDQEWGEEGYGAAAIMFFNGKGADPIDCGFLDGDGVSFCDLQKAWEEAIPDERVRLDRKRMAGQVS